MRDRKQLRQHIRAARDWLGEADSSLEHENDVRSNLKLMLAQAELQRAKESLFGTPLKRWGMRLLPLLTAMVLLAGGLWLHSVLIVTEAPAPAVPQESHLGNTLEESEQFAPMTEEMPAPAEQKAVESSLSEDVAVPEKVEEEKFLPIREEIRQGEVGDLLLLPKEEPVDEARIPSENMQKLMQSAGKVLRAE